MQVVLMENVKGLGRKGEVKTVKDGYFYNFLLPKKYAQLATQGAVAEAKKKAEKEIVEKEKIKEEAKTLATKLEGMTVELHGKAKLKTLYAAVGVAEIIEAILSKAKIRLTKNNFVENVHLKELGEYLVKLKLSEGVFAQIKVKITEKM